MNLVLIGYRGTGKSAAGKIIAEQLGMDIVSMDEEIVRQSESSIPDLVEEKGWKHFRDIESDIACQLGTKDNLVIDCGGGVIERPENIETLKQNGLIIWLKASVPIIVKRISDGTERPALVEGKTFTEEIEEVLERRTPIYKASSSLAIDTDTHTPEDTATEVVSIWKSRSL